VLKMPSALTPPTTKPKAKRANAMVYALLIDLPPPGIG
jgi:hypothetical protein